MNNHQFQPLFKQQSTKSLSKYRSESIEKRASKIGKELLIPSFPRKIEPKNVFTITSNTSTNSAKGHNMHKLDEDLQKRVAVLQNELKRKLNEDSILRNLFKTKLVSQMSHLNLYLEFRKLEDKMVAMNRNEEERQKKIRQYEEQMRGQQQQHMKNMEELNQCVSFKEAEWLDEKIMLGEEINKHKIQNENNKYLMEQMKKKNAELIVKQKQISEELNLERQAHNLTVMKLKADYQREIEEIKSKITKSNAQKQKQQKDAILSKKAELEENISKFKDEKQRLQMQVVQLQQINRQLTDREQWFRKQQKQKYSNYYEKLRRDYEIQIENLMRGHQQSMCQQRKEVLELRNLNVKLNDEKIAIQQKINEKQKVIYEKSALIGDLQNKETTFKQQIARWQDRNSKLSRQIKEIKYEKQQIVQRQSKIKFQLSDLSVVRERLQKKVSELTQQNLVLTEKCDELKRVSEYSQSYLKLNDKIYNQNYKTLGRLIQVNHKLRQHLNVQTGLQEPVRVINQQSLSEVVSYLAEQLEQLIRSVSCERRQRQEMQRQRNIQNREIVNVLQQCKNLFKNEYGEGIMSRYIAILKSKKGSGQESNERVEAYHQLIDCFINLNNTKYYNSEGGAEQKYEKDSLDGTFILKQAESNKKFSKHAIVERESSCKNLKRKNRMQTEPSVYDMPLKCRVTTEEDDKENVYVNNRVDPKNHRKQARMYLNQVRERLSSKNGSKWKDRPQQQEMRSQIQRKYFRS